MSDNAYPSEDASLLLAAEECNPKQFASFHKFSTHDEAVIRKLIAHGPVLLQGGRGTGKSAFMLAAALRMAPQQNDADVIGLYISLRYVPLLKAEGAEYERLFCEWVSSKIGDALEGLDGNFPVVDELAELKHALSQVSTLTGKRIVLLFDDAAHIGRETSLASFFDLFRTLSSDTLSCKASIYPGVTEFGARFDVYNDATVVDVVRHPEHAGFSELFSDIARARFPEIEKRIASGIKFGNLAAFVARAVLANVRAFVFALNDLLVYSEGSIGYNALNDTVIRLAADYYWPLLEEVRPKLGKYTPAVETAQQLGETIFDECARRDNATSVLVHRRLLARYSKPFEILEYAGFIARREASRAMKSGGRGSRYSVNLCNLLEAAHGSRLTAKLFGHWLEATGSFVELHEGGQQFADIPPAKPNENIDLAILSEPIDVLKKSKAYPYGLTELKIDRLKESGIETVRDLATANDEKLRDIDSVGPVFVDRFRSVVAQAVWM